MQKSMGRKIAICNQKGGVGKTTTTVSLGVGLAREGFTVLLVDADPQGDLTASLGWYNPDEMQTTLATLISSVIYDKDYNVNDAILTHAEGVDIIPSNIELSSVESQLVTTMSRERTLKTILDEVSERYDYILIDCMPSLGMMTINALTAADSVIIPVQAQYLSAKGMTQLLQTTAHAKSVFEYDPRGNVTEAYRKLSEEVKANGERLGSLSAVSTKRSLLDTGAERQ